MDDQGISVEDRIGLQADPIESAIGSESPKTSGTRVQSEIVYVRTCNDPSAVRTTGIEMQEVKAVKPIEAILCSEPHKSVLILDDRPHVAAGQAGGRIQFRYVKESDVLAVSFCRRQR